MFCHKKIKSWKTIKGFLWGKKCGRIWGDTFSTRTHSGRTWRRRAETVAQNFKLLGKSGKLLHFLSVLFDRSEWQSSSGRLQTLVCCFKFIRRSFSTRVDTFNVYLIILGTLSGSTSTLMMWNWAHVWCPLRFQQFTCKYIHSNELLIVLTQHFSTLGVSNRHSEAFKAKSRSLILQSWVLILHAY